MYRHFSSLVIYMPEDFAEMSSLASDTRAEQHGEAQYAPTKIFKDGFLAKMPQILSLLLKDNTTKGRIIWATDDYAGRGAGYQYSDQISVESVIGDNGNIIVPRSKKPARQQQQRSREMAEVFTSCWICNKQNNLIDNAWFGRENVFNAEIDNPESTHSWKPAEGKIQFTEGKSWVDYVTENRMEITCGEAPYLASRYDAVTGNPLPVDMRIGLLDRKLRIVGENTMSSDAWLAAAKAALCSTYGYEWQGDNLLLARVNLLVTILDFYHAKFGRDLPTHHLTDIAGIISWNLWQMDGLKGVIPSSCRCRKTVQLSIFGDDIVVNHQCEGCKTGNIHKHTGTYSLITEWVKDFSSAKAKHLEPFKFIDLLK